MSDKEEITAEDVLSIYMAKSRLLENLSSEGISNEIYFFTEVTPDTAVQLIHKIKVLSSILEEDDPIFIFLNTPGGSATAMLSIIDAFGRCPNPIVTVATGLCASAGVFLLAAGDVRLATKNAIIFYHEPINESLNRSPLEFESSHNHYKALRDNVIYNIFKPACTKLKNRKVFDKKFMNNTSLYISPKEALEVYGLVEGII